MFPRLEFRGGGGSSKVDEQVITVGDADNVSVMDDADGDNNSGGSAATADSDNSADTDNTADTDSGIALYSDPTPVPDDVSDVTILDSLDTDSAGITNLTLDELVSGTAPFDSDDAAGNDSSADNLIVRSFDRVTYNYSFSITPDDSMTYYKSARVGFRMTLPCDSYTATFDTGSMSWTDTTNGYAATVTEDSGVQTLVAYRLLEANSLAPTIAPGTYSLPLVVKVLAADNGSTIQPSLETWVSWDNDNPANTGSHAAETSTPDALTVSAKLNINIMTGTHSSLTLSTTEQRFNFSEDAAVANDLWNNDLGYVDGTMFGFMFDVQMRWTDRSKGLRGLTVPTGDISFTVDVSTTFTDVGGDETEHDADSDFQPYIWDVSDVYYDSWSDGRNPQDYGYSGAMDSIRVAQSYHFKSKNENYNTNDYIHHSRTWENGYFTVTEERFSDRTRLHVTVKNYDVNPNYFPTRSSTADSMKFCGSVYSDSDGTDTCEVQVGSISTVRILMVSPTYDSSGVRVTTKYNSSLSVTYTALTGVDTIQASSADGQTVNVQSVTNDDTAALTVLLEQNGNFVQEILWGCAEKQDIHNGVDCGGYTSINSTTGTDLAMPGAEVSLYANARTYYVKQVLTMTLLAFDADILEIPDNPKINYGSKWDTNNSMGYYPSQTVIRYAVKKDGSNWTNYDEQNNVDLANNNLDFYDTPAEAKQHGVIVGVLYTIPSAVKASYASSGAGVGLRTRYDLVNAVVKSTTPVGTTTALTGKSYTWDRNAIAGVIKSAPSSALDSDDDWENWARNYDSLDLYSQVQPSYQIGSDGKYKMDSYANGTYQAGGTGGRAYGDTLHIVGESPKINISVEQKDSNGDTKKLYDIDNDERIIDVCVAYRVNPESTMPDGYTTNVRLFIRLPDKIRYRTGSGTIGGTYTANSGNHVTAVGGESLEPTSVIIDSAKDQVLTFNIPDTVPSNTSTCLHLSLDIGDAFDDANDVINNEQFTLISQIVSTLNPSAANSTTGTYSITTIQVSRTRASQLAARATQIIVDVNEPIQFISMLNNSSQNTKTNALAVNQLPYDGNAGSSYHGTRTLTGIKLASSSVDLTSNNLTVRITTLGNYGTIDPSTVTAEMIASDDFTMATVDSNGNVIIPSGIDASKITMFTMQFKEMLSGGRVESTVNVTPTGNQPRDLYVNQFSDTNNTVTAMSTVANRRVSGVIFIDGDMDGKRSTSDETVSDVTVTLARNNDTSNAAVTLLDGSTASMVTGVDGSYEFNAIPAGTYRLIFTPNDTWKQYRLTIKQAEGVDSTLNSDADEQLSLVTLTGATIDLTAMPTVASMSSSVYADTHQDVGLIRVANTSTLPSTGAHQAAIVILLVTILLTMCATVITVSNARRCAHCEHL